jgi:hypothetical protein
MGIKKSSFGAPGGRALPNTPPLLFINWFPVILRVKSAAKEMFVRSAARSAVVCQQ